MLVHQHPERIALCRAQACKVVFGFVNLLIRFSSPNDPINCTPIYQAGMINVNKLAEKDALTSAGLYALAIHACVSILSALCMGLLHRA